MGLTYKKGMVISRELQKQKRQAAANHEANMKSHVTTHGILNVMCYHFGIKAREVAETSALQEPAAASALQEPAAASASQEPVVASEAVEPVVASEVVEPTAASEVVEPAAKKEGEGVENEHRRDEHARVR